MEGECVLGVEQAGGENQNMALTVIALSFGWGNPQCFISGCLKLLASCGTGVCSVFQKMNRMRNL